MAPFGRESPISYSTFMVLMTLSASVSKLQPSDCYNSLTSDAKSPDVAITQQERQDLLSEYVKASHLINLLQTN